MKKTALAIATSSLRGRKAGDSPRKAIESPDSLFSIANARIIDAISEGEIEGFAHGNENMLQDVYYDETAVENPDGSRNFKFLQIEGRMGTQTQEYIPGFAAVENELAINVALTDAAPWTRSFTNKELSAVRVRLGVSALVEVDQETNDSEGSVVDYSIELSTDGGPFTEILRSAFRGKTTSPYERGHRIDLPVSTLSGWVLRVNRLTPDSSSQYLQNATMVVSVTEIIDGKFRYPMTALVATQIDASQFQSIPVRAFHMKGRRIKVPANYDPVTRTYATTGTGTSGGAWDGTFKTAYSNNPAWVFYDLATHKRYGLGHLVSELVFDKWSLYAIGQYCDETVPDGFGGFEPRMTCNLYLQKAADAWKVLGDLTSVFRGICYWAGGAIVPVADRPTDPVYTYTNGNVVGGRFTYQSSSRRARHTAVMVSYNDMTDMGRLKTDYYDDPEGIARFGFQLAEVTAIGCTSRGQAQRFAKWILLSEKLLTNTCSFSVGLDGTYAVPGQIVRVADKFRAGRRIGGRVRAATASSVTVDSMPSPAPMIGDTLIALMPTGITESRTVSSVTSDTISVSVPFSEIPVVEAVWAVEMSDLSTQLFRVLAVEEGDDGTHNLDVMQHNPSIFDAVDFGEEINNPPISVIPNNNQARPVAVVITSVERAGQVIAQPLLTAKWDAPAGAVRYNVQWRKDNGEWSTTQVVYGTSADYESPFPGKYVCKVEAVNILGVISVPQISVEYILADQTKKPTVITDIETDVADAFQEIADEVQNRIADVQAEADARAAAILAEAQARTDAIATETAARQAAIQAEADARAAALLDQYNTLHTEVTTETLQRETADENLALAISTLAAGSGEQFDAARPPWYYDSGLESWGGNGTPTVSNGYLRPANASNPHVYSPIFTDVDGSKYRYVKARIRKTGNPTWDGKLFWQYPADQSWTSVATISEPTFEADGDGMAVWKDVPWPADVNRIRIDLGSTQTATDYFEIDWVAIGRPSPGASMAALQTEESARITADAAEATQRTTLATQMRGSYTGTDVTQLTQGLVWSERQARSTADSAEVTARELLSTKVAGTTNVGGLTLATLSAGLLYDERQARSTADATEVTARELLSATLTGFNNPSGKTLADLTQGIIFEEKTARATAVSAEASSRTALSTKLTGVADPASKTLATLTAGLLYDEREARSSADGTEVTARQLLSTKVTGATDPSGLTLATLSAGLLYDERQARSTADSSEVTARQLLSTTLTGFTDPSGKTLAQLSSGLLFEERTARVTADSAMAQDITTVQSGLAAVDNAGINLVLNPSAEFDTSYWQNTLGLIREAVEGHTRFRFTTTSTATQTLDYYHKDTGDKGVPVDANATHYSARAEIFNKAANTSGTFLAIRFFDAAGAGVGSSGNGAAVDPENSWQLAKHEGVAIPPGAAYVRLRIAKQPGTVGEPVYFRRVKLEAGQVSTPFNREAASAKATELLRTDVDAVTGAVEAMWGVTLDVNGYISGLYHINNGTVSETAFLTDVFKIIQPSGGAGLTWEDGVLWNKGSTHSVILGQDFGASQDLMLWAGPNPASAAAASKSNAVFWLDNAGNGFFAGSLASGKLKFSATGSSTSATASVVLGPFNTNGGNKAIEAKFFYFQSGWLDGNVAATYNGQAWSASGVLEYSPDGTTWTQFGTWAASGTRTAVYEPENTSTRITTHVSDTDLATDTYAFADPSHYVRMRITARSAGLALYGTSFTTGSATHAPTQELTITSTEG